MIKKLIYIKKIDLNLENMEIFKNDFILNNS